MKQKDMMTSSTQRFINLQELKLVRDMPSQLFASVCMLHVGWWGELRVSLVGYGRSYIISAPRHREN